MYAPPQTESAYKFIVVSAATIAYDKYGMRNVNADFAYNITMFNENFKGLMTLIRMGLESKKIMVDTPNLPHSKKGKCFMISAYPYGARSVVQKFVLFRDVGAKYYEMSEFLRWASKPYQVYSRPKEFGSLVWIERVTYKSDGETDEYEVTPEDFWKFQDYMVQNMQFAPEFFIEGGFDNELKIFDDIQQRSGRIREGSVITIHAGNDRLNHADYLLSNRVVLYFGVKENDETQYGFMSVFRDAIFHAGRIPNR